MSLSINSFNKSDLILQMVEIRGFGVFSKKNIRPRKFVNPKTKEISYLGETSTMHFKASDKLLVSHD